MWNWLKKLVLKYARKGLYKAVDRLDDYKDELRAIVDKYVNPEEIADVVLGFVKDQLKALINKVFGWFKRLIGGKIVDIVVETLNASINGLDKFKPEIVKLIEDNVNADELVDIAVNFVKEKLYDAIDAIIPEDVDQALALLQQKVRAKFGR